jgi:hypothetical protein
VSESLLLLSLGLQLLSSNDTCRGDSDKKVPSLMDDDGPLVTTVPIVDAGLVQLRRQLIMPLSRLLLLSEFR